MTAYATIQDMVSQFGGAEMIAITDRDNFGAIDEVVAEGALQRASDTINSYLAARFALPLQVVPTQLADACCDIARYKLVGANASETDVVRLRYKDALKMLEQIRDGKLDVGLTAAGQAPAAESAGVRVSGPVRVFDDNSLRGY